ncbi:probable fatty acyl-CoA reductase 4 isoform X2 [Rhodamnia argentea]|uniref:Fatty acyl-CoA reductase n=1 Tax=Rhodamnia argentea TaxID=178133 RepID=A0A8B8QYY1_9MYRT|nr:probable fatty acyl-CoA reductase 4 isoform X2 [Rhodamnia argentea]
MGLDIVQFLENKTILVTGATGFLAKIFVEKILRVQPNVKKMYVFVRATDKQTATRRLHEELIQKELFDVLRKEWPENFNSIVGRLDPIPGDVSCENLGVHDLDIRSEMWREVDIIVNSAATTKFDERYDIALAVNAFGAKHVAEFAARCANLKMLLHVSTAYVCGEMSGIIREKLFSMGETPNGSRELDVNEEKLLVEGLMDELREKRASQEEINIALKDLGLQRARLHGWPNTYTLTKAMGEMMVQHHLKQNIPLVVMRPTIITSTYREPFAGWIEGFPPRTLDSIAVRYSRGRLKYFLGNPNTILDTLPADMVVNAMIVAIAVHADRPNSNMVYQVGSSMKHPMTCSHFRDIGWSHFKDNPWITESGKPVKVRKLRFIGSKASFNKHLRRYTLLSKVLKIASSMFGGRFQSLRADLDKKVNATVRLAELYEPYVFFKGIFDDTNTDALRATTCDNGVNLESVFYFDPRCIDWEDYFKRIHLPGVVNTFKSK